MPTSTSMRARTRPWRTPDGIRIRPLCNRTGSYSYRVEVPESITGQRLLKQFKTAAEAESFAAVMVVQRQNSGLAAFALTDRQREDAKNALEILRPAGATLVQAAEFFLRHHCPLGGDVTISQLLPQFMDEKRLHNLRPRSLSDLHSRLNVFERTFGEQLVRNISSDVIKRWLLEDPTYSDQSRLNFRRVLHGFFHFAMKQKYIALNPVADIEIRVESTEPGILSVDQARVLLATAQAEGALELGPLVTLGLFCGIRSEELAKLDWRFVNLEERFVTISKQIAKKRRVRNVPLEPNAVEWLLAFGVKASGLVAPMGIPKRFRKLLAAAKKLAGEQTPPVKWFDQWPVNGLRHSFASYFFAKTSNAAETCARLGQRSDDVLFEHYRSLVRKRDAERFFELRPAATESTGILPLNAQAA